jgi:Tol biopolymer transport system component
MSVINGQMGINTIELDLSGSTPTGSTPEYVKKCWEASWSPDDTKWVIRDTAKSGSFGIYIYDLSTGKSKEIVKNAGNYLHLDWSRA